MICREDSLLGLQERFDIGLELRVYFGFTFDGMFHVAYIDGVGWSPLAISIVLMWSQPYVFVIKSYGIGKALHFQPYAYTLSQGFGSAVVIYYRSIDLHSKSSHMTKTATIIFVLKPSSPLYFIMLSTHGNAIPAP